MKKKYIQYRLGLLTGLLSLGILSSCVHTNRGLGMYPISASQEQPEDISLDMGNERNEEDKQKGDLPGSQNTEKGAMSRRQSLSNAAVGAAVVVAGFAGSMASYYYGYNKGYNDAYNEAHDEAANQLTTQAPELPGTWPFER